MFKGPSFKKWGIIIVGLAIRLCVAPFTGHPCDMLLWESFGQSFIVGGVNPYAVSFAYPPPWILITGLMYSVYLLFPNDLFLSFILKLPIIIGDLLVGLTLFNIVFHITKDQRKAEYAIGLYMLNPYVIWISSIWGMFDSLPALCTLLAFMYFVDGKKEVSAIFLGLGIAFKYYPILLLPIVLLYEWKQKKVNDALRYVLYALIPLFVVSAPFLVIGWQDYIDQVSTVPLMVYRWPSTPASFLAFIYIFRDLWPALFDYAMANSWWVNILSYSLFLAIYASIILMILRQKSSSLSRKLNSGVLAALLAVLLSSKMVCEQYFQWAVPFIILDCIVFNGKNKRLYNVLWLAFFTFFSINVPFYNFIWDVQKREYAYTSFLKPLVDWYEYSVPGIYKSTSLFALGLTISITCAWYIYRLLKSVKPSTYNQDNMNVQV